ncbi:MAG: WD40/YVTN/BNR-like repeat-containing protein [Anaerolineae bacterium]|nr:hypothetical protein [Anaerolineae bacterium]
MSTTSVEERLYLGTQAGLLVLDLGPEGWRRGEVLWRDRPVLALAVDPFLPQRLHAVVENDGLYRSEDGGRSWDRYRTGDFQVLALRPDRPEIVYAGSEPPEVYRSTDSGGLWTAMRLTGHQERSDDAAGVPWRVRALVFDPARHASLYVGVEGGGLVRTYDGGREWIELTARGLPLEIKSLLPLPEPNRALFAGTAKGLYCSLDEGFTWTADGIGMAEPEVLALAHTSEGLLAAAHPRGADDQAWGNLPARLYRRPAGSARWWQVSEPLDGAVHGFSTHSDGRRVYAGTTGGTVWTSNDAGLSWRPIARGLPPIHGLALDAQHPDPSGDGAA